MESDTFTKKYNFRLPDRTIEKLDKLVEGGLARNRTDALVFVVDTFIDFRKNPLALEALLEDIVKKTEKIESMLEEKLSKVKEEHAEPNSEEKN